MALDGRAGQPPRGRVVADGKRRGDPHHMHRVQRLQAQGQALDGLYVALREKLVHGPVSGVTPSTAVVTGGAWMLRPSSRTMRATYGTLRR